MDDDHISSLIKKAAEAASANDAMAYSQAACNSAKAISSLADARATLKMAALKPDGS